MPRFTVAVLALLAALAAFGTNAVAQSSPVLTIAFTAATEGAYAPCPT